MKLTWYSDDHPIKQLLSLVLVCVCAAIIAVLLIALIEHCSLEEAFESISALYCIIAVITILMDLGSVSERNREYRSHQREEWKKAHKGKPLIEERPITAMETLCSIFAHMTIAFAALCVLGIIFISFQLIGVILSRIGFSFG